MPLQSSSVPIERIACRAYRIPADAPESDGTLSGDSTVLALVEVDAGGRTGPSESALP
ncbi:MAG TPA: hypothetical protein VEC06_10785 [Paucimonas sp.]|nr:hypothetical protein [Paucimonas sp.]